MRYKKERTKKTMNNTMNNSKNPMNTAENNKTKAPMSMDEVKEEFFKSMKLCDTCPYKLNCPTYPTAAAIAAFLMEKDKDTEDAYDEDPLLKSVYEDDEEEDAEEACDDSEEDDPEDEYSVPSIPAAYRPIAELDDLDSAVDDLVDSLFDVMDKIASARQFLDKLDSRVTWTLDMLGQLDIPQLSEH